MPTISISPPAPWFTGSAKTSPPEEGVLIGAVLGNAVRWLTRIGQCRVGQSVAIVGPGQQGMAATVVAKESGAGPILVVGLARDKKRLELCRKLGADILVCSDEADPVECCGRRPEAEWPTS